MRRATSRARVQAAPTRSADRRDHAVATDLIATGQIDLSPIIDATFPLLDAAAAFERATSSPSYRVMLHP